MYMDLKKYFRDFEKNKKFKYPVLWGLITAGVTLGIRELKNYLDKKNLPDRARKVGAI